MSLPAHLSCFNTSSKNYNYIYQLDTSDSFAGCKVAGCRSDHCLLSTAKVKNVWGYTSIFPYIFMVWCSARLNFLYFYLLQCKLEQQKI
jgi:hypothetical protein